MAGPVQSVPFSATTGTTISVTLSATGTGNCLVCYFGVSQGITHPAISGITLGGAAGNWTQAAQGLLTGTIDGEIWIDWNAASGQTAIVITVSPTLSGGPGAAGRIEEWPGVITGSNPVDTGRTNAATAASGSSWSSGSTGTLGQPGDLVVGLAAVVGGSSTAITGPASPWTNQAQTSAGTIMAAVTGWQIVAGTGAQTYSGTNTGSHADSAVIVPLQMTPSGVVSPALAIPRRGPARAVARGVTGPAPASAPAVAVPASGWLVARTRHSDAIWGGVTSSAAAAPGIAVAAPRQLTAIPRRRPARAYVRFAPVPGSNAPASLILPLAQTASCDGKTWLKKRWILGGW
jgi:hypothetical protein